MKKLPLLAVGAIALAALTGCTAGSGDATNSPKPSAEAQAYVFPEVTGECIDGTATISADDASSNITIGDCANVVIEASNSIITVGVVENLTMNTSISLVTAASVQHITFGGEGNKVITPGEPVVEGDVENNEVAAE